MSVINELIRVEENGTISFGNYMLAVKSKVEDFEHDGDLYKVKTFNEITKLERNGMFVYESVPGTAVNDFCVKNSELTFAVSGSQDAQSTIQLEDDMEYEVFLIDATETPIERPIINSKEKKEKKEKQ